MPKVYTFNETCGVLKIGQDKLSALIRCGELKGFRSGQLWRFTEAALDEYIALKMECDNCPGAAAR